MGGSDCDRYDGWVDESLPFLLERFKIQKRDVKEKGQFCWKGGGSRALWGERGMRRCDKVFEDERSYAGKGKGGGGGYRVSRGEGQTVLLW